MAKKKKMSCKTTFRISQAGHLLSTKNSKKAGSILSTEGKKEKAKRLKRGCLNGTSDTFQLSDKQKKKLPLGTQRGLLEYYRKKGKRIIK